MDAHAEVNFVDAIVLVLLLIGAFRGLRRGLSGELASIISIVLAVLAGVFAYGPLGERIHATGRFDESRSMIMAFFLALAAVMLALFVLRITLRSVMSFTFKGALERIGGALTGAARSLVIVAALIFLIGLWPNDDALYRVVIDESFTGQVLHPRLQRCYADLASRHPDWPKWSGHDALGPTGDAVTNGTGEPRELGPAGEERELGPAGEDGTGEPPAE